MHRCPARRPWRRLLATATAALVAPMFTAGATAQAAPSQVAVPAPTIGEPGPGSDTPVVHDPRVDADLATVPVSGPDVAESYDRYRRDDQALRTARDDEAGARADLTELDAARARLDASLIRATRVREKAGREVESLRRAVAAIAVMDYMQSDSASALELSLSPEAATRARGRRAVSAMVRGQQLDDLRAHRTALDEANVVLGTVQAELTDVEARQREKHTALDDARQRQRQLEPVVEAGARAVGDARLTALVRGADFVLVALDAYHRAAKRLAGEQPACGIGWHLLAGIAKTESGHGTFRGARLDPSGRVTRPIIGIPLDGSNGTARITDTDGGTLDGDGVFDRAVGPLQFIPSTWKRWGRDGNGDGRSDPQNIYDAALAAASYLCAFGPGLDSDTGMRAAVFRYNLSESYVNTVVSRARAYEQLRLL